MTNLITSFRSPHSSVAKIFVGRMLIFQFSDLLKFINLRAAIPNSNTTRSRKRNYLLYDLTVCVDGDCCSVPTRVCVSNPIDISIKSAVNEGNWCFFRCFLVSLIVAVVLWLLCVNELCKLHGRFLWTKRMPCFPHDQGDWIYVCGVSKI